MTFTPTDEQIAAILKHAEKALPLECCGVIADGGYIRLINQATDINNFSMDLRGFRNVAKAHKVEAIVHSHVYLPAIASDADRSGCERINMPWLIVCYPTGQWVVVEPSGFHAPLVGRLWAWGAHDCYGLIRDGFLAYTGIVIPDFERDWMFWKRGEDIIADQYAKAGFVEMPQGTPPQHCDVMGMRIDSKVINHLGLYLADEASGTHGVLLHQLMNKLSVREVYGGTYLRATELHLRHQNFITAPPPELEVAPA